MTKFAPRAAYFVIHVNNERSLGLIASWLLVYLAEEILSRLDAALIRVNSSSFGLIVKLAAKVLVRKLLKYLI